MSQSGSESDSSSSVSSRRGPVTVYEEFEPASSSPVQVPISSSPGAQQHNLSSSPGSTRSESSIRSIDYAYSLSRSTSTNSGVSDVAKAENLALYELECEAALHRAEFSNLLTERLLQVPENVDDRFQRTVLWRDATEATSSPPHPQQPEYRLIKRAHSIAETGGLTYTPRKFRKLDKSQKTPMPTRALEVPTAPASPAKSGSWRGSIPIIAPPPMYNPRLPLNSDTEAKIRLAKFLEREGNERSRDGLHQAPPCFDPDGHSPAVPASTLPISVAGWEKRIDLGRSLRERAIAWMATILPKHPSGRTRHSDDGGTTSRESSFASTSTTNSSRLSNLYDQLSSCPETRFHAIWMFLRYFFIISASDDSEMKCCHSQFPDSHERLEDETREKYDPDQELIVWDIALACLALSVKFHRDFLIPLYPIQSSEFLELARHDINYEEFETAQRDVLAALSHSVGVSPQPILDELWRALSSLRELLDFEGGWNGLQKEVWLRLYDIIYGSYLPLRD
ncbi:hypothetical protein CC2G_004601 [Coprinopsis cinerea AmutBmut pab1-1]|nr:hypothetical protein CC2G_004601 [Coprinopsis cinerea AmutBmut pab1-1]